MYGPDLGRFFIGLLIAGVVVGAAIGALALWLIPLVWNWAKPFIHQVTA